MISVVCLSFDESVCILQADLKIGEEIAHCPSCSLYITVVYNPVGYIRL